MKRRNKISIGFLLTGLLSFISVIGSTAGTLAWYVYSRSVRVEFVGTSVAKSALLTVGLIDDAPYKLSEQKIAEFKLVREEYDGHSIVFSRSTDGLDYHVIQEYLRHSEYAIDLLFPLTTQTRTRIDQNDLVLYESPLQGETDIARDTNLASTDHYVKLPFAFKMTDTDGHNKPNVDIWLTDTNVKASGEKIDQAVRVFIENSQRKFLMRPADRSLTNGATNVGGLLDLDGDGTYDYDVSTFEELYYGEHTGGTTPVPHETTRYGIPQENAPYVNVNHVEDEVESTFYSKHNELSYVAKLDTITPAAAEYYTLGTVKPSVDPVTGKYIEGDTGFKICTTDSSDYVGYASFTIYIEGWDHSVIDRAAGYSFNLSLRFETSRD